MNPKLIMLVEDDINLRQSFVLILQRAGYQVTATECAHKAMDMLQRGNYQLVISDSNIPGIQTTLIPGVLQVHPHPSILILTDKSASEVEMERQSQTAHYLNKPIAPERLLDYVQMLVDSEV